MSIFRTTLLALLACAPLLTAAASYDITTAWPVNAYINPIQRRAGRFTPSTTPIHHIPSAAARIVGCAGGGVQTASCGTPATRAGTAAMISDDLPATRELMDVVARRFNERFHYRWERIIEFLKLHYLLSRRGDTDFWMDNRRTGTVPGRLLELLALRRYRPPSRRDFHEIEEIFPAASYQYVLYGMGFEPEAPSRSGGPDDLARAEGLVRESADLARKYLAGLPSNRALIDHVRSSGLPRI